MVLAKWQPKAQIVKAGLVAFSAALVLGAMPAWAHFQSIYTPLVNLADPGTIPVDLIFWHPLSSGATMNMAKPEEFFVMHRGEKTDLLGSLKPFTFTTTVNSGQSFRADVDVRTPGDYIFALVPQPYHEETEDIFIQQMTKAYVNRGQLPTDWDKPLGLKVEIVPLNRPYNILVGSTFTGQVLSEGKPVAGAEIEVEYIAAPPDMTANKAGEPTVQPAPGGTINAVSDDNGYFTFGIPRAGWWGFAALGVGPDKEMDGKELSQDAVIWITATDFGGPVNAVVATNTPAAPAAGGGSGAAQGAGGGSGNPNVLSASLQQQITASIRNQLRPIRTDMALYRATETYPMILGGIGFIIGLGGLVYFTLAHTQGRRSGQPRRTGP